MCKNSFRPLFAQLYVTEALFAMEINSNLNVFDFFLLSPFVLCHRFVCISFVLIYRIKKGNKVFIHI